MLAFSGQQRYSPASRSGRPIYSNSNRTPAKNPAPVNSSEESVDLTPVASVRPETVPVQKKSPATAERAEVAEKVANLAEITPLVVLTPNDLLWPERVQGDRSTAPQSISLLGDTRTEGLYVIRTRIPKGKQIVPHVHGDSRSVVVISGTYYYGIGETFDSKQLRAFPPGSFLTEPAGMPHFSWAKDEEVVIQTTAIGPSSTRVLPDAPVVERE